MELIAAILIAGPLGYLVRGRRALVAYLVVWAVIFPVQCWVVSMEGDLDASYWPINAVILLAGIGLNGLGARLHERRVRSHPVV